MKDDLTTGNVYQKMIWFMLPILVGNLLWQFYNIADSAIVGRALGSDALAAVGASWQISNIMLAVAMGLTLGMGILISTAYGGGNKEELQKIVDTGLIIGMVSALFCMIVGIGFAEKILLLYRVPKRLMGDATLYFLILMTLVRIEGVRYLRIISAFFLFFGVMHCLNGILLGLGKSSLSLIGSVLSFCIFQVVVL